MPNRLSIATFIILVLVSSLVIGCAEPSRPAAAPGGGSPGKAAEEEAKSAVPGSYEDWCDEHQVPESQCTRCNASLIPAFKATGDWCETHQLPKSQDLADNPGLKIERPPKPEGGA